MHFDLRAPGGRVADEMRRLADLPTIRAAARGSLSNLLSTQLTVS